VVTPLCVLGCMCDVSLLSCISCCWRACNRLDLVTTRATFSCSLAAVLLLLLRLLLTSRAQSFSRGSTISLHQSVTEFQLRGTVFWQGISIFES